MVTTHRPSAASFERRLGGHSFPINDQPPNRRLKSGRFIPGKESGSAERQVHVTPMGRCQERMTAIIVQEQEGATAQNLAGAANHATWQKATAVHWFPMAIQEEDRHRWFAVLCGWFPQARRPVCQRIGQCFSATRLRYLRKKPLDVPIPVSTLPAGEER